MKLLIGAEPRIPSVSCLINEFPLNQEASSGNRGAEGVGVMYGEGEASCTIVEMWPVATAGSLIERSTRDVEDNSSMGLSLCLLNSFGLLRTQALREGGPAGCVVTSLNDLLDPELDVVEQKLNESLSSEL